MNNLIVKNMKKQTMGERLKLLRSEYGLSQTDLASLVKLSGVAISNIETGVALNPYPNTLQTLCKTLGTTLEWLKEGKGEMLPNGPVDLDKESTTNPYRDYAIQRLEGEVNAWKEKYEKAWTRLEFFMDKMHVGKRKTLRYTASPKGDGLRVGIN